MIVQGCTVDRINRHFAILCLASRNVESRVARSSSTQGSCLVRHETRARQSFPLPLRSPRSLSLMPAMSKANSRSHSTICSMERRDADKRQVASRRVRPQS